jgi:hypothetical protein
MPTRRSFIGNLSKNSNKNSGKDLADASAPKHNDLHLDSARTVASARRHLRQEIHNLCDVHLRLCGRLKERHSPFLSFKHKAWNYYKLFLNESIYISKRLSFVKSNDALIVKIAFIPHENDSWETINVLHSDNLHKQNQALIRAKLRLHL